MNLPNGLAGTPDLKIPNFLHLLLILLSVVGLRVVVESALGLLASLDAVVQLIEQWLQVVPEAGGPVDGTTTGSGGASGIHPVHTIGTDQRIQRLGGLLDGLVEGLRGGVAALTENLILSKEHTVDTAHQAATLTVQVRVDLLLEGGLVEVTRSHGDTHGDGPLLGLTSDILVDSNGGVDTTALTEERADGTAGALGGDENDINILRDVDVGQVLENGGESVGEVKGLALGDHRAKSGPGLTLSGIGEKVHNNGTLLDSGVDVEQVLAGDPAVLDSLLPGSAILTNTNNDIETLVTQVETLAVTLGAITDQCQGVVLEVLLELRTGPIVALVDGLLRVGKGHGLYTTDRSIDGHTGDGSSSGLRQSRSGEGSGDHGTRGGHAGHAKGTGKTTRSHCGIVELDNAEREEIGQMKRIEKENCKERGKMTSL